MREAELRNKRENNQPRKAKEYTEEDINKLIQAAMKDQAYKDVMSE